MMPCQGYTDHELVMETIHSDNELIAELSRRFEKTLSFGSRQDSLECEIADLYSDNAELKDEIEKLRKELGKLKSGERK